MADESAPSLEAEASDWRRISPLAVLDMAVTAVKQGAIQALPGLFVLFATAASSDRVEVTWVARALIALGVVGIGWAFLSYLRFGYRVNGARIEVRKGVLHRQTLNVDFDRIQNVSVLEPFYLRPFGQAVVSIDTAGSSGKEIRLPGLLIADAQALRQQLVNAAAAAELPSGETAEIEANEDARGEVLVQLTRKDVVIAGLTANFMLWAAIAIGTFFGSGDFAENWIPRGIEVMRVEEVAIDLREEGGNLLLATASAGVLLLAFLLLPLLSVIGALFRYDGYTLTVDGDRFRRTSGMLSKHDDSVRQHKIQGVTWKQNAIAKLFGRINLQLRQASAGTGEEQMPGMGAKQSFAVPSLRPGEADNLSARFLPGYAPAQARFSGVDRRRFLVVCSAIPLLVSIPPLITLSVFADGRLGFLWLVVAGITLLVTNRCWRQTGWAVDGDHVLFRKGFIGATTTLFPLFKVQRVDLVQTRSQRRRGLAHLTLHLASHSR